MSTPTPSTPLVDAEAVGVRLGVTYSGAEEDQVSGLCDDVSELIRAYRPSIDTWLAEGRVRRGIVTAIAAQAVARVLTSVQTGGMGLTLESHPEYTYQLSQTAAAGLILTPAELKAITPPQTRDYGKAFTIRPA